MYEIQQLLLQIVPLLSFYPFFSFSKEQKICSNFHPHRPHSECNTNFSRRSMTKLAVDQLNVNAAITLMRVVVVVIVVGIVFFLLSAFSHPWLLASGPVYSPIMIPVRLLSVDNYLCVSDLPLFSFFPTCLLFLSC